MKNIVLILMFVFGFVVSMQGQTLTSAQRNAKNEIYRYLKNKVSTIEQNNNDISFSYKGTMFFIGISDSDEFPFFATLSAIYSMSSSTSEQAMNAAIKETNNIKGVKAFAGDSILVFASEMYFKKAEHFNAVVFRMIDAIEAAKSYYNDIYEKKMDMSRSSSSAPNQFIGTTEFYFPYICNKGTDPNLYITRVHIDNTYTIVDFLSFNNRQATYCGINKNAYLLVNGKRYYLKKTEGISIVPKQTEYPNWKSAEDVSLSFRLYFAPIPRETTEFDFIEQSEDSKQSGWFGGWTLRGVLLDNNGWKYFSSEKINTPFHTWECTAIQIQNGQIVLRKRVTPKQKDTYVCSENEEFIEDADTGRKYYLKMSSISFNSSPVISHDTNPIDFTETYPALPSSVKRINISSGSQYYIKGMTIR